MSATIDGWYHLTEITFCYQSNIQLNIDGRKAMNLGEKKHKEFGSFDICQNCKLQFNGLSDENEIH